jgi:hypothetical protein
MLLAKVFADQIICPRSEVEMMPVSRLKSTESQGLRGGGFGSPRSSTAFG